MNVKFACELVVGLLLSFHKHVSVIAVERYTKQSIVTFILRILSSKTSVIERQEVLLVLV